MLSKRCAILSFCDNLFLLFKNKYLLKILQEKLSVKNPWFTFKRDFGLQTLQINVQQLLSDSSNWSRDFQTSIGHRHTQRNRKAWPQLIEKNSLFKSLTWLSLNLTHWILVFIMRKLFQVFIESYEIFKQFFHKARDMLSVVINLDFQVEWNFHWLTSSGVL